MRLQFGLGTYDHRARHLRQIQQNCYLEQNPLNSKNPIALHGSYGVKAFASGGNGVVRGGRTIREIPYVVVGTKLYRVTGSGMLTSLGDIPGTDRVSIAGDENNVGVAANATLYVWDGASVTEVADPDLPGAEWVEYIDTYFVVGWAGRVYISGAVDITTWNALDFITPEANPDNIVGAIVEKRELFLGGSASFEMWVTSTATVPLSRVASGFVEIGLLSKHAIAKTDNSVFFVADDFTVRRFEGYTPLVISTPAEAQMIEDLVDKRSLYMSTFEEGGHSFVMLTSDEWTLVFDASTQLWHTRKSEDKDYWRPLFAMKAYDSVLVGDRDANRVGKLDGSTFADWGDELTMISTAQAVHADGRNITGGKLELVFQGGVGLSGGQGENPLVGMRQSFDDQQSWTAQRFRHLGKLGKTKQRAVWTRMGQARDRVIEFEISDPVRRSLMYANLDIEVGDS